MTKSRANFREVLERLRSRSLTDEDYDALAAELEKVVQLGNRAQESGGRQVVVELPFGLDLVK